MHKIPPVSDDAFQAVLMDVVVHPMSSMKSCAARIGFPYKTVTYAVRHMVAEGTIIRRRIGQIPGKGATYANFAVTARFL
jgi:predicted transcriptional regulator